MADFMVGWNTYQNGINQDYRPGYSSADGVTKDYRPGYSSADDVAQNGREPGEECQTCKNRKYKDGSDENVSFKAASHISPEAAAGRVRAHEGEHVANAYSKAAQKGGEVLSVSVRLETAVCPECGKNYVSGGTTSTKIRYPVDSEGARKKNAQTGLGDAAQRESLVNSDAENQRQNRSNPYAENQKQVRANAVRGKGFDYATRPLEEFEMERY